MSKSVFKPQLPLKHLQDLPVNYYYRIYNQRRLQTKYGEALMVYSIMAQKKSLRYSYQNDIII